MASKESQIFDALVTTLQGVTQVKAIFPDRIFSASTDLFEHELPAVFLYDVAQEIEHVQGRKKADWFLVLEIVMKQQEGVVDQKALFDLRRTIELALWAKPNLGIPGVIHMHYQSNFTDLHLVEPYYIARMEFNVQFFDSLVDNC